MSERPLTVDEGTNHITGLDISKVRKALDWAESFKASDYTAPKLWDGAAAERIVNVIDDFFKTSGA